MRRRKIGRRRQRGRKLALQRDSAPKLSVQLLVDGCGAGDSVGGGAGTVGEGEPLASGPDSVGCGDGAVGSRRLCSRTAATAATETAMMMKAMIVIGFVKSPMTNASPVGGFS